MHGMAKHKPAKPLSEEPKRNAPSRTGIPLNVYVDPVIDEGIRQLLDRTLPRTTKTALVEMALLRLLHDEGIETPGFKPAPQGED